jgi:hypothetical protein
MACWFWRYKWRLILGGLGEICRPQRVCLRCNRREDAYFYRTRAGVMGPAEWKLLAK